MVDVLLATSYFLQFDPKQIQKMRPYPPLATLHAAAVLRRAGYSVALFDAMLSTGESEFEKMLAEHKPRVVVLFEDNFNFLSKMCLTRMRDAACAMIRMARSTNAFVAAAGSDVSDQPSLYLAHGAHVALIGEGDHALSDLVQQLAANGWHSAAPVRPAIAGLAYIDGGHVAFTPRRTPERHPDVLGSPAWDLIDADAYRATWKRAHGYFSLNMASTRGCPFHCNWCAKPIWGQRYAMRSPAQVAEEMALLKRLHRPDHIWFADDIFGLRPQWVEDFACEVKARDAVIPFMIQSRADLMTDQAVRGLKAAGCVEVWLGAESGSQKVLDAMDKGTTVDQIQLARRRLGDAGIKVGFFIQFGYPGEMWDDILLTVRLVRDALPDAIGVSVSYPLPGTRFFDLVKMQLGEKTHWADSDELAMMFEGTYRTPFYKKLHGVLHHDLDVYRLRRHVPHDPRIEAEAAALAGEWRELAQLERECRNASPTSLLKLNGVLPSPDVSREWN